MRVVAVVRQAAGLAGLLMALAVLADACAADAAGAAKKAPQPRQEARQSTKGPEVDPELLRRIQEAAMAGKKPCPCAKGGASS